MWNHHGLPPEGGSLLTRDNIYDDEEELLNYEPSSSSSSASSSRFLGTASVNSAARNAFLSSQLSPSTTTSGVGGTTKSPNDNSATLGNPANSAASVSANAVANAATGSGPNGSSFWSSQQNEPAFAAAASSTTRRVQSRFSSWNQNSEEEREEEALPSYLSYLSAPFNASATPNSAPSTSRNLTQNHTPPAPASIFAGVPGAVGGSLKYSPHGGHHPPPPGLGSINHPPQQQQQQPQQQQRTVSQFQHPNQSSSFYPAAPTGGSGGGVTRVAGVSGAVATGAAGSVLEEEIEVKTRELAQAFRSFISSQFDQPAVKRLGSGAGGVAGGGACSCGCDATQQRVAELENQLKRMQQQINRVSKTVGNDQKVHGVGSSVGAGSGGASPGGANHNAQVAAGAAVAGTAGGGGPGVAANTTAGAAAAAAAAGALMNDRVSTLEGRQSAFQSQLAQISRVLGIPAGKAGKHQQQALKTLVQTLREEIDTKVKAVASELEANMQLIVDDRVQQQLAAASDATKMSTASPSRSETGVVNANLPSGFGSYEQVLEVLAQEHEASLKKLSEYFEDRLLQEQNAREKAEKANHKRLNEQEEWLQQLEAAASGGPHISFLSCRADKVQGGGNSDDGDDEMVKVFVSQRELTEQLEQLEAKLKDSSAGGGGSSNSGAGDANRLVNLLQSQFKSFQVEIRQEMKNLQENMALVETGSSAWKDESGELHKQLGLLKKMVERVMRTTGSAESLLQQYMSTITEQVASVTRKYVTLRIRENNRLIDATLRARVPAYVENESEKFMLVTKCQSSTSAAAGAGFGLGGDGEGEEGEDIGEEAKEAHGKEGAKGGVVLREDEQSLEKLLSEEMAPGTQ